MSECEAPEGYHWEWFPDPSFQLCLEARRKCRRKGCQQAAVAVLDRGHKKNRFWAYCGEHLYGRIVANGVVMVQKLVKNEAA